MSKPPNFIVDDIKSEQPAPQMLGDAAHPPAEEDLAGGYICSPEYDPSSKDDKPLA